MRVLILSDIHANLDALDAVLALAPAHDAVWNLGDVVGYGANPNEVIDRVRGLGNVFVRGNHDRACSGLDGIEDFNPIAGRAARWTRIVLSAEHTQWLREIPCGPLHPDGPNVSCAHGSLLDEDQYVTTVRDAWAPLHDAKTRINFFGHTHLQGGFATNGQEWFRLAPQYGSRDKAEEFEMPLRENGRYLINPGSVGQPRDGDWRAAFAIYDDAQMTVTYCRVPYNVKQAQARIVAAGLPDRLAIRLREGR
ncbi:metallophosphoesterase family protein [Silvibacterium dinghuense]|uniref:Metallophosphoesterase n=1 Tax=Silvibacterium dinghuense TaxID=1560006 RepID=A0A4Q1SKJ0_9BACT|nr:metallophosphoesterase family protein [Silvibacterium dinghuense]RXS97987.1 metallophosphoesterase [Silvibacterium dinghuense]GGH03574.1 metallophosphoesterase [Silvibacterium dinghuense]